jgi:hypothetical protein
VACMPDFVFVGVNKLCRRSQYITEQKINRRIGALASIVCAYTWYHNYVVNFVVLFCALE